MEIRKLSTSEEYRQIQEINAMSFFYNMDEKDTYKPEKNCSVWGAVEKGKVQSIIHVPEYEMMVNGRYVSMFGIGGVSTRAECRNKGYIRRLFSAIFEEMVKRDVLYSYLYPFSFAYYEKFGYTLGISKVRYRLQTQQLKAFTCNCDVALYQKGDPSEPYDKVFHQFARQYNGMVKRTDWKRLEDYKAFANQKYMYIFCRNGEPVAYMGFAKTEYGQENALSVMDMAWADIGAFQDILGFIGSLRAHLPKCEFFLPDTLPLDRMLVDTYSMERQLEPAGQIRVIDAERALELYPWPQEAGSVTIKVQDGMIGRNSGTYRVSFGGGPVAVERTGTQPDLELDIRTLGPLTLGAIGYGDLLYMEKDRAWIHSNHIALEQIFQPRPAYITESF